MSCREVDDREEPRLQTCTDAWERRLELASIYKVGYDRERLTDYLCGKAVFPTTLELDLTSQCTRTCPECPSSAATSYHALDVPFLDRLFGFLQGCTPGLLLTGGEPTVAPLFSDALRMARSQGFREIAVVTNGSQLDDPVVADSLVQNVTTIRLSMYEWERGCSRWTDATLKRIERLRKRADQGSELRIGVSALTSNHRLDRLAELAEMVRSAGAHWLYFHPLCTKWGLGSPELAEQDGVTAEVLRLQALAPPDFRIFYFPSRYQPSTLCFDSYHAAHFLLVIGADGMNYLGPEVKYQPEHVISDLRTGTIDGFLWEEDRQESIKSRSSVGYAPLGSRHRSLLYSDFIERLRLGDREATAEWEASSAKGFLFPHIL